MAKALRKLGHAVELAEDGEEALWRIRESTYDTIVLDLMLPKMNGLAVLATMRQEGRQTPVLLLTARNTVEDRVQGLRLGADDYLGKPFSFDEFLARVEALCRRAHGQRSPVLEVGDLRLDTVTKVAKRSGARGRSCAEFTGF